MICYTFVVDTLTMNQYIFVRHGHDKTISYILFILCYEQKNMKIL